MKETLNVQIGRRVRKMREFLQLSREQLAERSDLSTQFIGEIENGKKSMTTNSLYKVAKALNVSADFIVFGKESQSDVSCMENLLVTLTAQELEYAQDLLKVFIQAIKKN